MDQETIKSGIVDIREYRKEVSIGYDWRTMAKFTSNSFEMGLGNTRLPAFMTWGLVATARLYTYTPRTTATSFSYPRIVGWKINRGTLIDMNLGPIRDALYGNNSVLVPLDICRGIISENILQIGHSIVTELNDRMHPAIVGKYGFPDKPEITRLGSITYTSGVRVLLIEPTWVYNCQSDDAWFYVDPINFVRCKVGTIGQPVFSLIDGTVNAGLLNQMHALDKTSLQTTVWWK